jgi:hypothetical protein
VKYGVHGAATSSDVPKGTRRPFLQQSVRRHSQRRSSGNGDHRAGRDLQQEIASLINIFAWQGKTFDAAHGTLTNRILAFGLNAIVAQVYKTQSWFDGKECIVLDYSKTSLVAKHIRDEIRQIGPGWYLGIVYWDKTRSIHFALQFPAA